MLPIHFLSIGINTFIDIRIFFHYFFSYTPSRTCLILDEAKNKIIAKMDTSVAHVMGVKQYLQVAGTVLAIGIGCHLAGSLLNGK